MVWQYITFQHSLKKGLLLTMIRIQGSAEARRCGAVAVGSQVITWNSALTLYALYLPLPPPLAPAPPLVSQARVLIATLVTLKRGIQGCPKTTSFDKSSWHPILKTSLYSPLFLPLYTRAFSQHPLPKNALPSSSVITPRILFPLFLSLQFFTLPWWMPTIYAEGFLEPPC
jgi:hypothetical protein